VVRERNSDLDIMKGLLTAGMVFAHLIEFFAAPSLALETLSVFIDLVSFSGFFFCFGFAVWLAYLDGPAVRWHAALRTACKCYVAFVISGSAFRILVDGQPPSFSAVLRVALLRDIPGYSEFLLSFAFVVLLAAVSRPLVRLGTRSVRVVAMSIVICAAATFLPVREWDPVVAQFLGGEGFAYFPVVPYLPLFLAGVFAARWQMPGRRLFALVACAVGASMFVALSLMGEQLRRFPPSALWTGFSAAAAYLYCWAAPRLRSAAHFTVWLGVLGRNVLLYLVVSNMFIFSAKALGLGPSLSGGTLVLLYAVLMGAIAFLQYLHTLRQPRTLFPTKSNGSFLHQVICAQSSNAPRLKKRSRFGRVRSLGFQQTGAVSLDCTFIAKVMQAAGESVGAVA
jgi:hypothetical protein